MRKMKNQLLQMFDLPSDVTSNDTRIEWVHNGQIQIENHQGIQQFTDKELKVNVHQEVLVLQGENLQIKIFNPHVLVITGKIKELRYTKN